MYITHTHSKTPTLAASCCFLVCAFVFSSLFLFSLSDLSLSRPCTVTGDVNGKGNGGERQQGIEGLMGGERGRVS